MHRPSLRHTGRLLALTLIVVTLTACGRPETEPVAEGVSETVAWQELTGGETLAAWRGFGQQEIPANWTYSEGVLAGEGGGPSLVTAEAYGDFELELEWKISDCGNSGIFYRTSEESDKPQHTAPEYQILDATCHPGANHGPAYISGANYALHPPADMARYEEILRPAGQWNEARIVVAGPRVEHWLNDVKIVEYELGSADWQARMDSSKFTQWPEYGRREVGHIALQDHGDPVWFRNVRIRPIDMHR